MYFKIKKVVFLIISCSVFLFGLFCKKEETLKDIRLVDYQPKPMLVTKVTEIKKAKYPAIDVHNHLRRIVDTGEDVSKFIKIMDDCNVKAVVDLDGGFGENLDKHLKVLKLQHLLVNFYSIVHNYQKNKQLIS